MSISKVLREGDLTAYERWELPLVDQEKSAERRQLDKGSKEAMEAATAEEGEEDTPASVLRSGIDYYA